MGVSTEEEAREWVKRKVAKRLGCTSAMVWDGYEMDESMQYGLVLSLFMEYGFVCSHNRPTSVADFAIRIVGRLNRRELERRIRQRILAEQEQERRREEEAAQTELNWLMFWHWISAWFRRRFRV